MFILDYRITYIYFRFVKRRIFILDLLNNVYDETTLNLTKHFIKFIVNDSLNLMNDNVILSNLTKAIYQI